MGLSGEDRWFKISNPIWLEEIRSLFGVTDEVPEGLFPNGIQSALPPTIYRIHTSDNEFYEFHLVGHGLLSFVSDSQETHYYRVNENVELVGKALLPKPLYVHAGTMAAMAGDSGAMIPATGEQRPLFNANRIHSVITALLSAGKMAPTGIQAAMLGIKQQEWTFSYYGDTIFMDIYENGVCLRLHDQQEWYQIQDAAHILDILSAG